MLIRLAAPGGHGDRGLTPGDGVLEVWATREFRYGGEHTVLRPRAGKTLGGSGEAGHAYRS